MNQLNIVLGVRYDACFHLHMHIIWCMTDSWTVRKLHTGYFKQAAVTILVRLQRFLIYSELPDKVLDFIKF
jgi:hypothetical protein